MSGNFDQIANELFQRGQIIRDNWFAAWVANIERMRQEFENSERFLSDYAHLLQQPMPSPHSLNSVAPDQYPSPPPGYSQVQDPFAAPPPLPDRQPMPMDEFMQQYIQKHGPPPGGG